MPGADCGKKDETSRQVALFVQKDLVALSHTSTEAIQTARWQLIP